MADDFQAEVCGGSWWSSPITTTFNNSSFSGTYGGCWQNNILMNMKTTSTEDSSGCCPTAVSPDTAFPIMGSSPSTTTNWYQPLLDDGRTTGESCSQTLPEILNINLSEFGMDQEQTSSFMTNSGDCTGSFVSTSYGYPSSLLQTIFDGTSSPPPAAPPQQPIYDLQQISEGLQLTNKAFFCNTSTLDINNNRADHVFNSSKKIKSRNEEISSESTYKRPRIETPSPLPTFKVRKEKLGDRVTALQQLVSPFGKTDTASVLHEAIEYIKLLHDQINVLSDPYMKNGATMQVQQINGKGEDKKEGAKQQDLRSRGLCLVPVSCTFPVATQTAPDYWTSCFKNRFK